jgi:hypothetical protein
MLSRPATGMTLMLEIVGVDDLAMEFMMVLQSVMRR